MEFVKEGRPLPCSNKRFWGKVSQLLEPLVTKSAVIKSSQDLIHIFTQICALSSQGTGENEFSGFETWIEEYSSKNKDFFTLAIPKIAKNVLLMPQLFPESELKQLGHPKHQSSVSLSQEQVLCLICNMFFCTIAPIKGRDKYWTNYSIWYSCDLQRSNCVKNYLLCLLDFLSEPQIQEGKKIVFQCCNFEEKIDFENCEKPLCEMEIRMGSIGDDPLLVEVDFANEDPNFGRGGTQEEILFGFSPHLHVGEFHQSFSSLNIEYLIHKSSSFGCYDEEE